MFARNSALVIGTYLLIALVVAGMGYSLMRWYGGSSDALGLSEFSGTQDAATSARPAPASPEPAYNVAVIEQANARIARLQASLERTSEMLERRSILLQEKSAECRRLQSELDQSLEFAFTVLEADAAAVPDLADDGTPAVPELRGELERLRSDLNEARRQLRDYNEQIDWLTAELVQSQMELTEFQAGMDQDLIALFQRQQQLETAAANTLAEIGEPAVTALIDKLADERPVVRRWAVATLGRIGPPAREAVPVLSEMRSDPDVGVQREVLRSLAAIEM